MLKAFVCTHGHEQWTAEVTFWWANYALIATQDPFQYEGSSVMSHCMRILRPWFILPYTYEWLKSHFKLLHYVYPLRTSGPSTDWTTLLCMIFQFYELNLKTCVSLIGYDLYVIDLKGQIKCMTLFTSAMIKVCALFTWWLQMVWLVTMAGCYYT